MDYTDPDAPQHPPTRPWDPTSEIDLVARRLGRWLGYQDSEIHGMVLDAMRDKAHQMAASDSRQQRTMYESLCEDNWREILG